MKKKKDLLTLENVSSDEIFSIIRLAGRLKKKPLSGRNTLKDKTLALLFQKPSNRTRVSFEVAMVHLGGYSLYLSPQEISMGTRESVKDVACVISRYVDGIVARVFSHSDVVKLAEYSTVPVINGLSDLAHPCQALSDIFTILEKKGTFKNVTMAYIGDGNNVLYSLLQVCSRVGVNMKIATPAGYEPDKCVFDETSKIAAKNGARFEKFNDPAKAVKGCDVVYTDVWVSMGDEDQREKRLKAFRGFQINEKLMRAAGKNALIMHCLPAHRGEEITDVIDGKNSIVYDQAENRMHVQKALLLRLMSGEQTGGKK
ncbi:MAG: ornithine carbamoyltransferase [Candidatus Omnitrophota bacterium]